VVDALLEHTVATAAYRAKNLQKRSRSRPRKMQWSSSSQLCPKHFLKKLHAALWPTWSAARSFSMQVATKWRRCTTKKTSLSTSSATKVRRLLASW
jgi:hypothetical protein